MTRLRRLHEHMTVQYRLNSLQGLTNSCVLNFRNKDNKKNIQTPRMSAISICALYFTSSLTQIKKKKKTYHTLEALCLPWHLKCNILLNCYSPRNLLHPALSSLTEGQKEWQFREISVGIWGWCGSSIMDIGEFWPCNAPKWFSVDNYIASSPEQLQVPPISSSWQLFFRWWREMQDQQFLPQ